MLHCPGKSWEWCGLVEGVKRRQLFLLLVKAKNLHLRMQFQKRPEKRDHACQCNRIIEKFTLASQAGKGKTGEVKQSGNTNSAFFLEKSFCCCCCLLCSILLKSSCYRVLQVYFQ